ANDLYGFTGNDTLVGSAGNDRLDGHLGIDVMTGGLGDDIYGVNDAGDQIIELVGQGFETVEATVSYVASLAIENVMLMDWTYFEFGGPPPLTGPINATGNSLNHLLRGNSEANILRGLGGIDSLSGGQGDDVLDGGTGADEMFGNL